MAAKAKAVFEKEKAAFGAVKAEQQKALDEEKATQLEVDREAARKMVEADQQAAAVQKKAMEAAMKKKTAAPKTTVPKQDNDDKPKGPKKPRTAYVFFGKENREKIKASMATDASMVEVTAEVSRQWGALANKTPYKTMADNDKERYEKELAMSA
jgi:HMG (high mobility group) box